MFADGGAESKTFRDELSRLIEDAKAMLPQTERSAIVHTVPNFAMQNGSSPVSLALVQ